MIAEFSFTEYPMIEAAYETKLSKKITRICRYMYEAIYNGLSSTEGKYNVFIDDDILKEFGKMAWDLSEEIAETSSTVVNDIFEQLLNFIKTNYSKTATQDEYRSRHHLDESNASRYFYGTLYNFNEHPDWESLVVRVKGLMF